MHKEIFLLYNDFKNESDIFNYGERIGNEMSCIQFGSKRTIQSQHRNRLSFQIIKSFFLEHLIHVHKVINWKVG